MTRKYLPYNQLAESTKERYTSMLKQIHLSGLTVMEVRDYTPKEFKNALGNKASLKQNEKYLSIVRQISHNIERKDNTVKRAKDFYQNIGYRAKGLERIEKELTRTIGNTYFSIVKRLQKDYKETEKKALLHARDILKISKKDYSMLEQKEQVILADFDY